MDADKFNVRKYFGDISKDYKKFFLTPELLFIVLVVIALNADAKTMGICMIVFYTLLFLYELKGFNGRIKLNADIIRTIFITLVIYVFVFILFVLAFNNSQNEFLIYDDRWLYYIIIILMAYFSPMVTFISGFINNVIMFVFRKLFRNN